MVTAPKVVQKKGCAHRAVELVKSGDRQYVLCPTCPRVWTIRGPER